MSARIASKKTKSRKSSPVSKNGKDAALNGKVMGVPVTNVTKFYFPRLKITKGDVINYYAEMASFVLPYLKNRPESLKRAPSVGGCGPQRWSASQP